MNPSTLLVSAALCGFATAACAQVSVFSDDFQDGNRDAWYSSSTSSTNNVSVVDGAFVVNAGRSVQTFFDSTTLASVGDTLALSFDVSFAAPGSASGGFRLGLFDSNGSGSIAADGNTAYTNFLGIMASTNPAATSGSPVSFRYRVPGVSGNLMTTTTNVFVAIDANGGEPVVFAANTWQHAMLTLTRTEDGLDLAYSMTSGETLLQSHSVSYGTESPFSFDTLGVSATTAVGAFSLDNVSVVYSAIPEPSTYAAIAGAVMLLGAIVGRRRLA